jgi:hypothetical protein
MQRQGAIHKKAFYSLDDLEGKADFFAYRDSAKLYKNRKNRQSQMVRPFRRRRSPTAIQRAISTSPPFVSGRWYNNIVIVVLHPPTGLVLQGRHEKSRTSVWGIVTPGKNET